MINKSIALFDLDKTIYNEHSFFPVARNLVDQETWTEIAGELERYRRGLQSYAVTVEHLFDHLGVGLTGQEYGDVLEKTAEFFGKNRNNFYAYFGEILPVLKKTHDVYIVTNNSQFVAEVIVKMFGLDGYMSTQMEVVDGKFTGKIPRVLADHKHLVEPLLAKYGGETIAVGDSEHDIGMLERVRHPICFQPSEELLVETKRRDWMVVDETTAERTILDLLKSLSHG